jgi:hypothetical protein
MSGWRGSAVNGRAHLRSIPGRCRMILTIGRWLTWSGWVLGVAMMFLPVSSALQKGGAPPGTPLVGWEAVTTIIEHVFWFWFWLYSAAEPRALILPFLAVATLVLLALPPVAALAEDRAGCVQVPLGAVPMLLLLLPTHLQNSLAWGIWVWAAALIVVSIGGLMRCLAAR